MFEMMPLCIHIRFSYFEPSSTFSFSHSIPAVVCVNFDIKSVSVIEGINRSIVLRSSIVEGRFQREVQIGVVCSQTTAVGVIPGA